MTFIELEQIINKPYLTSKEVSQLAQCNIKYARKLIADIRKDMQEKNIPLFNTRQSLVPTEKVLKKLKINPSYIRTQAREMRKAYENK